MEGGKEWQPCFLQHAIYAKIAEKELITSMKIEEISDTSPATFNEMLDLLLAERENIPEEGLHELVLSGGDMHLSEPLDSSVMQSLLNYC